MRSIFRYNPIGADPQPDGGVHFRVWAPRRSRVEVVLEGGGAADLQKEADGYFAGSVREAAPGSRYRYRLDGGEAYPDPASRYQPDGPHGPSQVVDPGAFRWTDDSWRGVAAADRVIYELHVGTFTPEGTWQAAAQRLPHLADLGITLVEVLPLADFPGRFGWGYDGVNLFAPTRLYGTPDDFRAFVDRAHGLGMGVLLDVVYNHLGPDGNYLGQYAEQYVTDRHATDWGDPINFDGPGSAAVREFYVANAAHWIREYHLDGLRLDATQNIYDDHPAGEHILAELTRAARAAAGGRAIFVVAENEPQDPVLVRAPDAGGYGLDAIWNDDFHHSAAAALTGRSEGYYTDHPGRPQELISAVRWGFLFQGQRYHWQGQQRGASALDLPPRAFVNFLQNHDQIANSAWGAPLHRLTSPGRLRAGTALLLLAPGAPMLFQGQEFAASAPFIYFADHQAPLAEQVFAGRREFLSQFRSVGAPEMQARIHDPADEATFLACKLDWHERERNAGTLALHRDLLRLRREDPVFRVQRADWIAGAVLGPEALLLRFAVGSGEDRLLLVNLGRDLHLVPAPEPLLAPPRPAGWRLLWSSEDPGYGGSGAPPPEAEDGWRLPGHAAMVLAPAPDEEERA